MSTLEFKPLSEFKAEGYEVNVVICTDSVSKKMLFNDSEENGWAFVEKEGEPLELYVTYQRMITETAEIDGPIVFPNEPANLTVDQISDMYGEAVLQLHTNEGDRANLIYFLRKTVQYASLMGYDFTPQVNPFELDVNIPNLNELPENVTEFVHSFFTRMDKELSLKEASQAKEYLLHLLTKEGEDELISESILPTSEYLTGGMTSEQALKLQNGDQVTINKTGQVVTVIQAYKEEGVVLIEVLTEGGGFDYLFAGDIS